MAEKRALTIHFTDGTKLSVAFPKQIEDTARMASAVHKALAARQLALEINNELFVVPMDNVKYVQLYPCPEKLPDGVIRGASVENWRD